MARVEIATQGWGVIVDGAFNPMASQAVTLTNLDDSAATVYSGRTGAGTVALVSDGYGVLPGFVEPGTYKLQEPNGPIRYVEAPSAAEINYRDRQPIHVRNYGAVGDGVTDDTAAIQAAIVAAEGKALEFEAGLTYMVGHMYPRSNTVWIGSGAKLKHISGSRAMVQSTYYSPDPWQGEIINLTISNLRFEGHGGQSSDPSRLEEVNLLWIDTARDLRIVDCEFTNCRQAAVVVSNGARVWIHGNKVRNCARVADGYNAITTAFGALTWEPGQESGYFLITNNIVEDVVTAGIAHTGDHTGEPNHHTIVANNIVRDCDWAGIVIEIGGSGETSADTQGRMVTIANNEVSDCKLGISTIETRSGELATVDQASDVVISSNRIDTGARATSGVTALSVATRRTLITGNLCRGAWGLGVVTSPAPSAGRTTDIRFTDNIFIRTGTNSQVGLNLNKAEGLVVRDNTFRQEAADTGPWLYVQDCLRSEIAGNTFHGGGTLCMSFGSSTANDVIVVSGNSVFDPNAGNEANGAAIYVQGTGLYIIKDNLFYATNGYMAYGVRVASGALPTVRDNTILGWTTSPIHGSAIARNNQVEATSPPSIQNEGKRAAYGTAAPSTGTWAVGDVVWRSNPSASGKIGFVCTTGGTPGTWKEFGAIDA